MPLCKKDRSVEGSIRIYSCIEEHAHARPGNVMACDGSYTKATPFPTHLQVRMPREGGQVQTGRSPSNLRGSPEVSSVGLPLTVSPPLRRSNREQLKRKRKSECCEPGEFWKG